MRIGVLSDTHIPKKAKKLPDRVFDIFSGVDYIFHAGDIQDISVLHTLEALAPVEAVAGNTDPVDLMDLLGTKKIVTIDGISFGIIHGDGTKGKTLNRALEAFANDEVDCVVFGHSHIPYMENRNGIFLFNPGSPTDKRRQAQYSCGILETYDNMMKGDIIYF